MTQRTGQLLTAIERNAQWRSTALYLWSDRDTVLGRDDSMLQDSDTVYVVKHWKFDLPSPISEIDYFHGVLHGYVIAQMGDREIDTRAYDMISTNTWVAKEMCRIQQLFRKRTTKRVCRTLEARRLLPRRISNHYYLQYNIASFLPPIAPPRQGAGRFLPSIAPIGSFRHEYPVLIQRCTTC
jgi:hypothetical protein